MKQMTKVRRILSILLSIALILTMTPVMAFAEDDTTPPEWESGWPFGSSVSDKEFNLRVKSNENGIVYYVSLEDGAPAPSADQVKKGWDAAGSPLPAGRASSLVISAGLDYSIRVKNLTPSTAYDIYVVLADSAGNLQASPELVEVITTVPDADRSGITNQVMDSDGSKRVTLTVVVKNAEDVSSRGYSASDFGVTVDGTLTTFNDNSKFTYFTDYDTGQYTVLFTGTADDTEYAFTKLTVAGYVIESGPVTVRTPPATAPPSANVCEIGGTPYSTLGEGLAAVTTGQTITVLRDVTETNPVVVTGKSITINLNDHDLTLDTSGISGSIALKVENGGSVDLTGTGEFNVIGSLAGVRADGASSSATVTNATAVSNNSHAADAHNGGNVLVLKDAIATIGASSNATFATSGGTVTVNGNAESSWHCAYANQLGSSVHIKGSATALAAQDNAAGAKTGSNAVVRVDQNVSGVVYGAHAESGGRIIVGGNVTANDSNGTGAIAEGSSQITIDGTITGTYYIKTGSTTKTSGDKTTPTTKPGYYTYYDGSNIVWVKATGVATTMQPRHIAAGSGHSLYLKGDGTVWAWGGNSNGELGIGTVGYTYEVPAQVQGLSNVKSIAAGQGFSLALMEDGTVWAWGSNGNGKLGPVPSLDALVSTPVQVTGLPEIQAISAGYRFALALDASGNVWGWGANLKGQLGQPTTEVISTPVQISGLSNIVAISAGNEHCMALDNHGRVWAWGDNYYGQLGNSSVSRGTIESYSVVPVQFLNLDSITVAAIYTGLQNSVLLTDSGTVYSIGYNGDGVLGNGNQTDSSVPVQSNYINITDLGGTGGFYTALRSDGTVWASGVNSFGELGVGTKVPTLGPVQVKGLNGVGFLNNIVEISQGKGGNHSLALDSSGTIWAWGYNGHEQCGVATWSSEPREITAPVNISFVPALSAASVSIVPPAAGGIPQGAAEVEAATANADYTVTGITWNEDMTAGGKFKAGQIYTATVTLTSKNGKEFRSAAFTPSVSGAASVGTTTTSGTGTGNTATFTATYPATAAVLRDLLRSRHVCDGRFVCDDPDLDRRRNHLAACFWS